MKYLAVITLLLTGCAGTANNSPAKKITQGEHVWRSCNVADGVADVDFEDQHGKHIKVYGDIVIEDDQEYVCVDGTPQKRGDRP